jgi:hypothetical protein
VDVEELLGRTSRTSFGHHGSCQFTDLTLFMRGAHYQQHAGSADSVGLRVLTSQTRAWNLMNKPGNCKTGTSNTCLRPDISRHVLYTMRDEPHSEGLDDISVPSVKWRSTGRGLLANGWAESPVTAAATTAVVANKVPMVRKKTGSGQG